MKLTTRDRWSLAVVGGACVVGEVSNRDTFPVIPTVVTLLAGVAGAVIGSVAAARPFEGAAVGAAAFTGFSLYQRQRLRQLAQRRMAEQAACTDSGGRWDYRARSCVSP